MPKIVAVDTDFEDNNLEEAMARDAGIEFEVTRGRGTAPTGVCVHNPTRRDAYRHQAR